MEMPRSTWNQALGAGLTGQNVALAALIEHTIEHNFSSPTPTEMLPFQISRGKYIGQQRKIIL